MLIPLSERFWSKVDIRGSKECWPWLAYTNRKGYGRFWGNGRKERSHRVAYELKVGPIPEGLQVLHYCDNPTCCNPNHLFIGTVVDNVADRDAKGRGNWPGSKGEANGSAKLTEGDIHKIKELRAKGLPLREIASRFGVSFQQVSHILNGKSWGWLK